MIRPAAKHILEFVAGVMTVLVVGGLVFAIKIASGPTSLRFLAPTIAAVLSDQMGGSRVEVKDAIMHWSPTEHAIELRITGVSLVDRAGNKVAGIPDLDLGLAMTGWKSGVIAPTRIRLDHASAIIERDINGAFSIGAPSKQASGDNLFPVVLAQLLSSNGKSGLGALGELSIQNADITLIDHRTGATVRAANSRVMFERLDHGFQCHMEAPAEIAGEHTALTLDGNFDSKAGAGVLIARFTPVGLSGLSGISNFYAPLKPFDVAVGGIAQLSLGANGVINRAQLSLEAEPGKFIPSGSASPIPIQSAAFSGTYWPQSGDIQIGNLSFDASGNRAKLTGKARLKTAEGKGLTITGIDADLTATNVGLVWPAGFPEPIAIDKAVTRANIDFSGAWHAAIKTASLEIGATKLDASGSIGSGAGTGSPAVTLTANVTNFQEAELAKYWPLNIAPHARTWVTRHVHSGQLTKGVFKIDAPAGALAAETIDDHLWRFDFHIDNGVTEYVFGMPPLTEASADMTLTPHTFALDLRHAKVLNGDITSGRVSIPELGKMGSNIDINAQGHGTVGEILRVIDSPPLKLLARYGLKPEQGSGNAEFNIALTIPEQSNIPEQALTYRVNAKGSDVKLAGLVPNVVIDHGTLDVQVTQTGLTSHGTFALDGAPMDVAWREKFHDHSGFSTDFAVKTTLDDEARAGLGFDTGTYVTGPVGIDMKIRGEGKKIRQLSGKLDFTPSAVDLGEYSFSKRSGVPTTVALNVAISEGGAVSVKSASATGKGVAIDGKAELAADGKLISANFPHVKLEGVADASANVSRQNGNGLAVRASGAFLNIAPIVKDTFDESGPIGKVPWRIDANLDSVVMRGGVNARNFRATLASTGPRLSVVDVRGQFAKSGDFSASLIEGADEQRLLVIASNDAGQLVKGATGIDSVLGGRLTLRANLAGGETTLPSAEAEPPAAPGSQHKMGVRGSLKIDDFRVVNAPVLAKLLTVGSLQGIADLLSGEGIQFTHLEVPFWYDKGKLGVEDGRAAGPAIGLTLQGVVDRKQRLTELNGTIVPAYSLNSVFGKVPVLGQLLVSRPGEGIFAFTYNIAGTTNDPQVTVNPLSGLAPGFLRRLFQLGETQAGALRLQEETGQTAQ